MRILYLDQGSGRLAAVAAALTSRLAGGRCEVAWSGIQASAATQHALEPLGLADHGTAGPVPLDPAACASWDILVALSADAVPLCPAGLPGHPVLLDWSDAIFATATHEIPPVLERRVTSLLADGYAEALVGAEARSVLVLDHLREGIIAHDLERRIVFFNRAAEEITGYSREEVLYRDCHEVFPTRFCGNDCSFCDRGEPDFERTQYIVDFTNRDGERRMLEMSVRAILRPAGEDLVGVVATFRDLTHEHDLALRLGEVESYAGIIGRDPKMLEVFELIRSVADASAPVLVQGESGTGKELVAAAIHNASPRATGRFVTVNCGALPEGLLESELFGHVRGAFTGAVRDKKGRFELADGGTIFLDELGDISPAMQVKLLRVLQEGTYERVGGQTTLHADVRVISATHKDLQAEITAGRFRQDLFYRLCVVPLELPPLRDRIGDIPLLAEHILRRTASEMSRTGMRFSPASLEALLQYPWPGNVRELQNAIQYAMVRSRDSVIEASHLPPAVTAHASAEGVAHRPEPPAGPGVQALTPASLRQALRQAKGNKAKAARLLGIGRATLYRHLKSLEEAPG